MILPSHNAETRPGRPRRRLILAVLAFLAMQTVLSFSASAAPPQAAADTADPERPTARKSPPRVAGDEPDDFPAAPSWVLRVRRSAVAGDEESSPAAARVGGPSRSRRSGSVGHEPQDSPLRRAPGQRPANPAGTEEELAPIRAPRPTVAPSGEEMMGSATTDTAPPSDSRTPIWVWLFLAAGLGLLLWMLPGTRSPAPSRPPQIRGDR